MSRNLYLSLLGLATALTLSLDAQTMVPFSTTSTAQGSNIITNYNDYSGPGLPVSSLFESRLSSPAGVPDGNTAGSLAGGASFGRGNPPLPRGNAYDAPPGSYAPPGASPFGGAPPGAGRLVPIPNRVPGGNLPQHAEEPSYTFPGLVARFGGRWVGSDYLYDVPHDIGVVVEVVAPSNFHTKIDTAAIRDSISQAFSEKGINPVAIVVGDMPPLPFFHVLIFVNVIEERSVAFICGRYFEGVKLLRLNFSLPGTVQAITWEKQNMIISSDNQFQDQVVKTSVNTGRLFADRVAYFAQHKLEQEDEMRLRCGNYFPSARAGGAPPAPRPRRVPAPTPAPAATKKAPSILNH